MLKYRCHYYFVWTLLFLLSCREALERTAAQTVPLRPSAQIDLSVFGYTGLSPLARFTNRSNLSLNFIDSDHLLFTFNAQKLLVRHPECPPTHSDHVIHAAIIDLRTRAIVAEADWYVHDFRRYLWSLGDGRFLVRRLNTLYLVDSRLHETLLFLSPAELFWTGVTADGKQLILASQIEEQSGTSKTGDRKANPNSFKVEFRDIDSLEVKRTFTAPAASEIESLSSGYADSVHSPSRKMWLVRFGSTAADRRNLMRVKSTCQPDFLFPSGQTLFVGRCSPNGPDYSVSVFTLSGHPLWRQRWTQLQHFPVLVSSMDGSRIAVSTVTANRTPRESTPSEDDGDWPDVEQELRVLETATGNEVLQTRARNVILRNLNYSLSPDGLRLVLIDGTELRLYDLPPMSVEERAKYVAMKADAPDLTAPAPSDDEATANPAGDDFLGGDESAQLKISAPARNEDLAAASPDPATRVVSSQKPTSTPKNEEPLTTFKAKAEEVVVDVVVTDSKGHAAKGLAKDDFQVHEDGKPQAVTSFREYGNGPAAAPRPVTNTLPAPNIFNNNETISADRPVGIILLDLLNTEPADQEFARQQLVKFLRKKPADMQFALCALTERLQLLQGFTADENALLANLNSKHSRPRFSSELKKIDSGDTIQSVKQAAQLDASLEVAVQGLIRQQMNVQAAQLDRRVGMTADALGQLARYLSSIPGRKSLVWLSGSFPDAFLGSRSLNVDNPNQSSAQRTYSDQLRRTANLLAEAHIAVYPVNVHGLTVSALPGADDNSNPLAVGLPGSQRPAGAPAQMQTQTDAGTNKASAIAAPDPLQQQMEEQTDARLAEEASMDQIASDTGGKAFQNTNGLAEAMRTAVELGSHYYLLSYSPGKRIRTGDFRKIKVSLVKRGYHVAHRRGYYAIDRKAVGASSSDLANTMNSAAMERGSPQARQLIFGVRVVPAGKPRKAPNPLAPPGPEKSLLELQRYSIDYAIAASEVRFQEKGDAYTTDLVLFEAAFGDKGTTLNRSAAQSTTTFNPKAYKDAVIGGLRTHQEFEAPVAATSLRLGVQDLSTGYLGTLELPLPLKAPPEEAKFASGKLPPIEPN